MSNQVRRGGFRYRGHNYLNQPFCNSRKTTIAVTNDVQTVKQTSGEAIDANSALSTSSLATLPGTSNAPKFGTLIPNRIFVGGIPANTTEQELKLFFSAYGSVRDAKIVTDRSGLSKGRYGFVTFETQEMAEKIIKNESENLIFKDRKLNIGHAIRKQQVYPRADVPPGTVFFTSGAVPYTFQNGMAVFQVPGGVGTQDYTTALMAAAQPTSYTTMMVPQPAVYVPQPHYAYQAPGVGAPNPAALAAQWQTNPQLAVTSAIAPAGVSANNAIMSSTGQGSHAVQQQPPSTPTGTGMIASTSASAVGAGAAGAAPITITAGPGGQWTGNRWAPQSPPTAAPAPLPHASAAYAVYGPLAANASSTPAAGSGDAPTAMIYHPGPHPHLTPHHTHPGAAMMHPTLIQPPHQQTTPLNSSATSDYSSEHGTGSGGTSILDTTNESETSPARVYHAPHPLDAAAACLSPYSPVAAAAAAAAAAQTGWSNGTATAHLQAGAAAAHLQSEPLIALAPPHHLAHHPRVYSTYLPQQGILQPQQKGSTCPVTTGNAPIVSLMKHSVPRSGAPVSNGQSTVTVASSTHQSLTSVASGGATAIDEAKVYNSNSVLSHDH